MRQGSFWGYLLFFATMGLLLQGLTEFNFGNAAVIRLYWLLVGVAATGLQWDLNATKKANLVK